MIFKCEECAKTYASKQALALHTKIHHKKIGFVCDKCEFTFTRITNLKNHLKTSAGEQRCLINILIKNAKNAAAAAASTSAAAVSAAPPSTSAAAVSSSSSLSSSAAAPPSTSAAVVSSSSSSSLSSSAATPSLSAPIPVTSAGVVAPAADLLNNEYRYCEACNANIKSCYWFYHLRTNVHKRNSGGPTTHAGVRTIRTAFQGRIQTLLLENRDEGELRPEVFLQMVKSSLMGALAELVQTHTAIKFNIELFGEYIKMVDGDLSTIDIKSHQTQMRPAFTSSNISGIFDEMVNCILAKMSEFQERDSGWTLVRLLHLEVNVNQYRPITGSNFIPLPLELLRKKACVNVHNNDKYCFKWAIISGLMSGVPSPHRCCSYNIANIHESTITVNGLVVDFTGLAFPLPIKGIEHFEKRNNLVSVNVFGYDAVRHRVVGPYYISREEKDHHINLLLLQQGEKSHYVLIKSLSR